MAKILNFLFAAFFGFCVVYLLINYKTLFFSNKLTNEAPKTAIEENINIIVDYPQPNEIVTSPLVVKGRARGGWFFEANFPIVLYYGVKDEFVETFVSTDKEWMTNDFIEFEVTLNFPEPYANEGTLDLRKSNPSGLPEHDDSLIIPIRFR